MADTINLTEKIIEILSYAVYSDSLSEVKLYIKKSVELLNKQILDDNGNVTKLESKLKMMEISFEQINNSRNDLIKELADCEMLNKELKDSRDLLLHDQVKHIKLIEGLAENMDNLKEKLEKIEELVEISNEDDLLEFFSNIKQVIPGDKS